MIFFISFTSPISLAATLSWSKETVDENGASGLNSITVDSSDQPHLAYCAYENGNWHNPLTVMYASWNGSEWLIQNVTQGRGKIDLALDSSNKPHIIFNDNSVRLMYARLNSTGWNIQVIDNGHSGSIALDSAGNPHIAYLSIDNTLKYASWTPVGWSIQTIDSSQLFSKPSLKLDSNDNPHILYGYNTPGAQHVLTIVKYAAYHDSCWSTQTVISDAAAGGFGNLALDSNGHPHFTYILPNINRSLGYPQYNDLNTTLTYVNWNGSAWNSQEVAFNIHWLDQAGYLALDSQDNPHIVYYNLTDSSSGALMYLQFNGADWTSQIVDSNSSANSGPIALDSDTNPHLIYFGKPNEPSIYVTSIRYATIAKFTQTSAPMLSTELFLLITIFALVVAMLSMTAYRWKKQADR